MHTTYNVLLRSDIDGGREGYSFARTIMITNLRQVWGLSEEGTDYKSAPGVGGVFSIKIERK